MIMMISNTFTIHWKRNAYPNRTQAYNLRRNNSVRQSTTLMDIMTLTTLWTWRCLWRRQTCTCRTSCNCLEANQPKRYSEPCLFLERIQ